MCIEVSDCDKHALFIVRDVPKQYCLGRGT